MSQQLPTSGPPLPPQLDFIFQIIKLANIVIGLAVTGWRVYKRHKKKPRHRL